MKVNLVHIQSGFNHLLILGEIILQVSEGRNEHGFQQDLEVACNEKKNVNQKLTVKYRVQYSRVHTVKPLSIICTLNKKQRKTQKAKKQYDFILILLIAGLSAGLCLPEYLSKAVISAGIWFTAW